MSHVENPPDPSALVESLRAFGYAFDAAICDIIDNSLAAAARHVHIDFEWSGRDSVVVAADDGIGMSADELIQAMKLGAMSPVELRREHDLGRFGLGMKTASFSQSRRLVVSTKRTGHPVSHAVWDLDEIAAASSWRMGLTPEPAETRRAMAVLGEHGTVVQWTKLDRFIGNVPRTDENARDGALRRLQDLEEMLGIVYADWMQGASKVEIRVNGNPAQPWDPFLKNHEATQAFPTEWLAVGGGRTVPVTAYVLPHHQRLSFDAHRAAGGPAGWNAHQGFYVFRNRRLLVMGGWLGLGMKPEEHYKLGRIRVDIENTDDHAWQIDVRKQQALVPEALRRDLQRIARATRTRASDVYRARGKVLRSKQTKDDAFVWQQRSRGGQRRFEINRRHPLVVELSGNTRGGLVASFLRLVEATVPVVDIALAHNEDNEERRDPWEHLPGDQLMAVVKDLFGIMEKKLGRTDALSRLAVMEPCASRPELVGLLREELSRE